MGNIAGTIPSAVIGRVTILWTQLREELKALAQL